MLLFPPPPAWSGEREREGCAWECWFLLGHSCISICINLPLASSLVSSRRRVVESPLACPGSLSPTNPLPYVQETESQRRENHLKKITNSHAHTQTSPPPAWPCRRTSTVNSLVALVPLGTSTTGSSSSDFFFFFAKKASAVGRFRPFAIRPIDAAQSLEDLARA